MIAQRLRVYATSACILVILGFAYVYVIVPVSTNGHGKKLVTVTVTFVPTRILEGDGHGVLVTVAVAGAPLDEFPKHERISPFVRVVPVSPGKVISVTAERDLIGKLGCSIMYNNDQVDKDHIAIGGMVSCAFTVPPPVHP